LEPLLPLDSAEVFFDGIFREPRLRHPEGIAIDASGDIWCGGETGETYRISADGSGIETVASTEGFILGLAFDDEQNLYARDMRHSAVFRLDTRTGDFVHFANGGEGTKCAFRGEELFTSNLGRWHITRIEARSEGLVLP
jgi:gluconolactonase